MNRNQYGVKEQAIRTAAALILMNTWRDRRITLEKLALHAKQAKLTTQELIDELRRRFEGVGLKLRLIKIDPKASEGRVEVFAVIDPRLNIPAGSLDRISAAILAMIFLRAGSAAIAIETILGGLSQILGDKQKAIEMLSKALRRLENMKLIEVNREERKVRLTSRGLAILPDREELEEILVDLIKK